MVEFITSLLERLRSHKPTEPDLTGTSPDNQESGDQASTPEATPKPSHLPGPGEWPPPPTY